MRLLVSITLGFIVPLVIGILVIAILTLTSVYSHVPTWSSTIGQAIKTEETKTITIRTGNRANLTKQTFLQFENDIKLMRDYAVELFSDQLAVAFPYQNFFAISGIDPTTPQGVVNGESTQGTSWFDKTVRTSNEKDQYENTVSFLNKTSSLLNVWQTVFKSNPAYAALYIGMNNGLFRHFPYQHLNRFPSMIYTCAQSQQSVTGYDPRCRGWYHLADLSRDQTIFTEPYTDANSGLTLISVAHAVVVNSVLLGVVSVDISMNDLDSQILSSRVLENGYTYLIDNNANAVIHPSIDRDIVQTIDDLEFSTLSEKQAFQPILDKIKAGETGEASFTKNGAAWFISYHPVQSLPYRIAMVVPQSDIDKAAHQIENDANSVIGGGVATLVVFFVLVIISSVVINVQTSKRLSEPITNFIEYLDRIKTGDLDIEMGNKAPVSAEMNILSENLGNLLHAVRFGNESYYQGDFQKALENFTLVQKMMTDFDNKRGLGVCQNNKANVLAQMGNRDEAKAYYNLAISNAIHLRDSQTNRDEVNAFNIVLANRYMNLGVFYKNMIPPDDEQAMHLFDESLKLHLKSDNLLGIAKVSGNFGQQFIKVGEIDRARELIVHAFDILKDRGDAAALQYAAMNMGLLAEACGEIDESMQWFRYSLDCCAYNPNQMSQITCIRHLANLHQMVGNTDLADKIMLMLRQPKNVAFVLDTSGSMSGGFIQQCRQSIKAIITDYISDGDCVSLTKFSSTVSTVFEMMPKSGNILEMIRKVDTGTMTSGMTAFYDAVDITVRKFEAVESQSRANWLIALTDGEDNKSIASSYDVAEAIKNADINVIVITVGSLSNERQIKTMCDACRNTGMHIAAEGGVQGIARSFDKAAQLIASDLNMESL